MKLSDAAKEIEEYVDLNSYDFDIGNAELKANGGYKFDIFEKSPYRDDFYFLTVEPDGRIINMDGGDCIEICKNAYDNDPELTDIYNRFAAKWIKVS